MGIRQFEFVAKKDRAQFLPWKLILPQGRIAEAYKFCLGKMSIVLSSTDCYFIFQSLYNAKTSKQCCLFMSTYYRSFKLF